MTLEFKTKKLRGLMGMAAVTLVDLPVGKNEMLFCLPVLAPAELRGEYVIIDRKPLFPGQQDFRPHLLICHYTEQLGWGFCTVPRGTGPIMDIDAEGRYSPSDQFIELIQRHHVRLQRAA